MATFVVAFLVLLLAAGAAPASGLTGARNSTKLEPTTLARDGNARVLLYVTTYDGPSPEHMTYMRCHATLLKRTPKLTTTDLLLNVMQDENGGYVSHDGWQSVVDTWPMTNKRIRYSENPGKQQGAKKAMHLALSEGWFEGYDWVIRIDPDVIIYDERPLFSLMEHAENWAVVMKCTSHQTNTDFFAVRPEHLRKDAFADWNQQLDQHDQPDAETQAEKAFSTIYAASAYAYLKVDGRQDNCHLQDGGVYHGRFSTCEEALDAKGWQTSFGRPGFGSFTDEERPGLPDAWVEAWREPARGWQIDG